MSILATTPESQAFGLKAKIYDDDLNTLGYVARHTKDLAVNPEAYLAFEALISAITHDMDVRRYELVTLAAAQALGSAHCRLAHGVKALRPSPKGSSWRSPRITGTRDCRGRKWP